MKPAPLFEIVDPVLSASWRILFKTRKSTEIMLLAFEEWCSEETYYERLSDRNERDVNSAAPLSSRRCARRSLPIPSLPRYDALSNQRKLMEPAGDGLPHF